MPDMMKPPSPSRRAAVLVLLVALGATAFGFWREREIARQNQIIRWQGIFAQIIPVLQPAISQRFEALREEARSTLRRENFSETSWQDFIAATEWRSRFPGMVEIGYAEFAGEKCPVKYLASLQATPAHAPGFDLNSDPVVREALQKCADSAAGAGSREILLNDGTNIVHVIIGLLPLVKHNQRPGTPGENRANLHGFVFFALDQQAYFAAVLAQMKDPPVDLRLLRAGETDPPRTASQRVFSYEVTSGEWRFFARMKTPSANNAPQWIVLTGGTAVSLLLYFLFATQSRLYREAERAHDKILARDAEITALNRGLEAKIAVRTAELNVALAEEKELNRLKGNFISMVTHEIRTPLALILGSSEILSRYLDRLAPEKRTEHLKTIDAAVQRMSELLEDVLLFSKAEAGRMEFNPVELDLKNFCTRLVDELLSATNRRCPIDLTMDVSEPARGDESLLRHIFSNLITNAVKYSPPGTPVKFCISRDGGNAVFIVQDRGMGIPEVDRKRLFTPFYRGKNVVTIQGTGLGLVIVKHCVERHGGCIEVDSAENLGTTVSVRLPLFSPAHTEFVKRISQNPTE